MAVRAQTLVGTRIFYAITYTISGVPAQWTIPSDTRLVANDTPRIATLYENVLVTTSTILEKVVYTRNTMRNHQIQKTPIGAL